MIRKFALKNALDYGKAQEGAVISKLIAADPSAKARMGELAATVKSVVLEVNGLDRAQIEREFSRYAAEFREAEQEKAERSSKHDFSIEGAEKGRFVTRFPPEPGGYMHIGHAKPLAIEDKLRRIYEGKLMLYFDDTNAENEKQEFVDAFHADLKWLGIVFDGEYHASDNLPMLYEYAEKAIGKGAAYVCLCSGEKIKEDRASGSGCVHKAHSISRNIALWKEMLGNKFEDNGAVLRFNSNMQAQNTTMRDPTLFRIKHAPHYRQGSRYWVWPTYDFCTPIVDSTKGVTDVLRSKEYELRDELYFAVLDALGLRKPRITSISRLEIGGNVTHKREVRKLIAEGKVSGWDDPRLVTIAALRRRGILPQAIMEFALGSGISKSESVSSMDQLLAINRRLLEKGALRLFIVAEPVPVEVEGADKNPNYKADRGLFINATDAKGFSKGDSIRLRGAFNIRIDGVQKDKIRATYISSEPIDAPRVPWISGKQSCELVQIGPLLVDGRFNSDSIRRIKGYTGWDVNEMEEGSAVRFEGLGLYKLDSKQTFAFLSL